MLLKAIVSHPDWDWKFRRDLPKVIELFANIVEKMRGTRPATKGSSPLKKVANQLVNKAKAKSSKTGNFLSEKEFKEKEHSWLSAREIVGIEWSEPGSERGEMEQQEARSENEPVVAEESDGAFVCQVCVSDPPAPAPAPASPCASAPASPCASAPAHMLRSYCSLFQEQVKAEGEGGRQETSRDIKTPEDIEDEEEMETERKKHLLKKIELAKKETTRYKTEYEGVKMKKEAKLKEKEDIMVSNLVPILSCSLFWLFSSTGPSSYQVPSVSLYFYRRILLY